MHTNKLLLVAFLVGCTDDGTEPCGHALHVLGDDTPIGSYETGHLQLDEHFLHGLPSDAVTLEATPLLGVLQLVVPTEDGTWRIAVVADGRIDDSCDWRFRTEVWTEDTLLGRTQTWHLLGHSTTCAVTKEIARWRSTQML